jgi:hypothetical protein
MRESEGKAISRRNILMVLMIGSLALASCEVRPGQQVTPEGASSTPITSPLLSQTPTTEFTQIPTVEPTKAIPDNPGFFEGVGEIASVEEHNGKWYGIDTVGRAEIVQSPSGEWIKYNRPMGVIFPQVYKDITSANIPEDLNQDEIKRLTGGALVLPLGGVKVPSQEELTSLQNEPLPFGVVLKEQPISKGDYALTHVFVSGYPLGKVALEHKLHAGVFVGFLAFAIPMRYETEVLLFYIENQPGNLNEMWVIPDSSNVQKVDWRSTPNSVIEKALYSSKALGQQIVIAFQINFPDTPDNIYTYPDNENFRLLVSNLEEGRSTNKKMVVGPVMTRLVIPQNILNP